MTRSMEIPEDAVEAAVERLRADGHSTLGCGLYDLEKTARDALEAAAPYFPIEVVIDHRPGETCSVIANVDPETGFARADAGDGGLREALVRRLATLPTMAFDNGYPVQALPKSELLSLLALHPAAPAVPQPVDREALSMVIWRAMPGNVSMRDSQAAADAMLALLGGSVLAGEQEQVAPE